MIVNGIKVIEVSPDDWKRFSESAHLVAFGKHKPAEWDRIDYSLLLVNEETDSPAAYITCRETDHETVYWQFGGAMPSTKGTPVSLRTFDAGLEYAKQKYKRVTFLVENTNFAMLKMALFRRFSIIGIRNFHGTILLEHLKEFGG